MGEPTDETDETSESHGPHGPNCTCHIQETDEIREELLDGIDEADGFAIVQVNITDEGHVDAKAGRAFDEDMPFDDAMDLQEPMDEALGKLRAASPVEDSHPDSLAEALGASAGDAQVIPMSLEEVEDAGILDALRTAAAPSRTDFSEDATQRIEDAVDDADMTDIDIE